MIIILLFIVVFLVMGFFIFYYRKKVQEGGKPFLSPKVGLILIVVAIVLRVGIEILRNLQN